MLLTASEDRIYDVGTSARPSVLLNLPSQEHKTLAPDPTGPMPSVIRRASPHFRLLTMTDASALRRL